MPARFDRLVERRDSNGIIETKVREIARLMRQSQNTIVYTGAGISTVLANRENAMDLWAIISNTNSLQMVVNTMYNPKATISRAEFAKMKAASIPDYRGPQGLYTLTYQGQEKRCVNLLNVEPTSSHMILKELVRAGFVQHVLSQNVDGLHLRSGIPQQKLSEIHGNMYIEVCKSCVPERQYIRKFDTTTKSAFKDHGTKRSCDVCENELEDTIVYFGELGTVKYPLNWEGTTQLVDNANLIICLGTSLNVLQGYRFLFPGAKCRAKLAIVNLQWTVKDSVAYVKVNTDCDTFFSKLAKHLRINNIPSYCRVCDPILSPVNEVVPEAVMYSLSNCSCFGAVKSEVCEEEADEPGWFRAGRRQAKEEHQNKWFAAIARNGKAELKHHENPDEEVRLSLLGMINHVAPPSGYRQRLPTFKNRITVELPLCAMRSVLATRFPKSVWGKYDPCTRAQQAVNELDDEIGIIYSDDDEKNRSDPSFKLPKNTLQCLYSDKGSEYSTRRKKRRKNLSTASALRGITSNDVSATNSEVKIQQNGSKRGRGRPKKTKSSSAEEYSCFVQRSLSGPLEFDIKQEHQETADERTNKVDVEVCKEHAGSSLEHSVGEAGTSSDTVKTEYWCKTEDMDTETTPCDTDQHII